ncbi:hypothetical protein CTI12_AA216880 [Artemisia annua]|uniref:Uncharacterized protein n=1 Tax=Artemisia annua TaxID=35608 RepID=A0A2U1NXA2_ARTAN|nr:hypothetical protein CTI12_AA216880 [Artemisia annua]
MASVCMSTCIADDARVPVRATYVNLYKWPESDREFVRSFSKNSHSESEHSQGHPRVVDSISCRQLYLRSYTFSRKESLNEKTMKCIERVKERAAAKEASYAALASIFRRLLSCTTKVDVVD